jgi:cell division protease FtsH
MSDKFENVVLSSQRSPIFLPGETAPGQREFSELTQQYIDEEITQIIKQRYQKAIGFLEGRRGTVEKIATRLLEAETIGEEEFKALCQA